jgi:ABC-2 type transport system ATP-binding protein
MSSGRVVWVRVTSDQAQALALLKARSEVTAAEAQDGAIKITLASHDTDHSIVAETLVRGGAKLVELREDELGLEEVFLRVTKGETQ